MTYNTVVFLCTRDEGLILPSFALMQPHWLGWSHAAHAGRVGKGRTRLRKGCACFKQPCPQGHCMSLLCQCRTWQTKGWIHFQCEWAPKLMRFCTYLWQLFIQSSSSFFNYFHFHRLSPSLEKFNLAALPEGQKSSYGLLTLDRWACEMAEVTMNPLAFTLLFFFFLHFYLSLHLLFTDSFLSPSPIYPLCVTEKLSHKIPNDTIRVFITSPAG